MPDLNWDVFTALPGAADRNWELLCRALVSRNYARYGEFGSGANLPGVEFHLKITEQCELGQIDNWFGWQCKWWDIKPGRTIGKTRKLAVEDAIGKTEQHLPGITDWVLWTRRPLTPKDQKWFRAIRTKLRLHQRSGDDLDSLMAGDSAVLRETYFGDLVLTQEQLASTHDRSVAPIKTRWNPAVHVEVEVEDSVEARLAPPGSWPEITELTSQISETQRRIEVHRESLRQLGHESIVDELIDELESLVDRLQSVSAAIEIGRHDQLHDLLVDLVPERMSAARIRQLARELRATSHPASFDVGLSLIDRSSARSTLSTITSFVSTDLLVIAGDAGYGKSFISAEITAPSESRPAGVLMLGRNLAKGATLDDLARRVPGLGIDSFEDLLEAVDAAGARASRRIPVVIDGLNEAENYRDWHDLIANLHGALAKFRHVQLIVTLRTSAMEQSLPQGLNIPYVQLGGFDHDVREAMRIYFEYYRIRPGSVTLPTDRFVNPLFLWLFCEATNPTRKEWVGAGDIPGSLVATFDQYRDVAIRRVADLLKLRPIDVRDALRDVALAIWEQNTRALPFKEVRELVGDGPRAWDDSLARALVEEGILSRDPEEGNLAERSSFMFDAFTGYLIADTLLAQLDRFTFADWIVKENLNARLDRGKASAHPLAEDLLIGFVGLVPRRLHQQFWPQMQAPLRRWAIIETAQLEGQFITNETADELAKIVPIPPTSPGRDLFDRLRNLRDADTHPLNPEFTWRVLESMSVSERDLRWSEWVRSRQDSIRDDIRLTEDRWRKDLTISASDRLVATWLAWTLTSTVRELRDEATRCLYWFGRGSPADLFDLTLRALRVNDPYVPERLLAASYGVVMSHQIHDAAFVPVLRDFLKSLATDLCAPDGSIVLSHWISREYVRGAFELAAAYYPETLPSGISGTPGEYSFVIDGQPKTISESDKRSEVVKDAFRMDFLNYTIGRIIGDRHNYDMQHAQYLQVLEEIRGRVWELGWREDVFQDVDGRIEQDAWRGRSNDGSQIERYGKKYGLIGYFEAAGRLDDQDELPKDSFESQRLSDVDIDPFFPESGSHAELDLLNIADSGSGVDKRWISHGEVEIPKELVWSKNLNGKAGSWVAVQGHIEAKSADGGRRVWGMIRGMLVDRSMVDALSQALEAEAWPGNIFLPSEPSDYYMFAGEAPWHHSFGAHPEFTGQGLEPYTGLIESQDSTKIEVETLSHSYSWENYHSVLNQAGGHSIPSARFSRAFDLRTLAGSFDQVDEDGAPASLSLGVPEVYESGKILYLREDLIKRYADSSDQELVIFIWGERQLGSHTWDPPEWLNKARMEHATVWRQITTLTDLGS